jgi:cation diffusion facilitator CzcD-associated flavoprotein CzcO
MKRANFDALVVGAGYGGIYQLHSLNQLGLSARVIDFAADVGGTWFWNRYSSDTESYVYRYSWDLEDLKSHPWAHHYVKQPEVLAYLEHVVERHDLRKFMQFNTEMLSADWDNSNKLCVGTKCTPYTVLCVPGVYIELTPPELLK